MTQLPEKDESLWLLAASPAVWAAHFLACYGAAAAWCEKAGTLDSARRLILALTVAAAAAIAAFGWSGWKRSRLGQAASLEFDTDEDRHRFLGYAALLLAALSLVATVYAGASALYFEDCR